MNLVELTLFLILHTGNKTNASYNLHPDGNHSLNIIVPGDSSYQLEQAHIQANDRDSIAKEPQGLVERSSAQIPSYAKPILAPIRSTGVRDEGLGICRERWTEEDCQILDYIISKESGWKVGITNAEGCAGLGQACPASKLGDAYGSVRGETEWTMDYIIGRYKTPQNAKRFRMAHNWY